METNPKAALSQMEIYESQIRECYGRVVYTHKTQEKCADILNVKNNRIRLSQIILTAMTTSGILTSVFAKSEIFKIKLEMENIEFVADIAAIAGIFAAIVSVVSLALTMYTKKYDLGAISQKHADAASSIWNIREKYLSLLTDIRAGVIGIDDLRSSRDKLHGELHKIYKGSPRTLSRGYKEASDALKRMEEMTFTDEEIDKFLPKPLRKNQC